jgi:L-methionine (R)-S-oxide reductase
LMEQFGWLWIGFYLVKENQLVLAPFQGPVACTRIKKGRGVCGASWEKAQTIIVPDVEKFPGHIACSSKSRSEIVVPVIRDNKVMGVLDVDSEHLAAFDETDKQFLEEIVDLIIFE